MSRCVLVEVFHPGISTWERVKQQRYGGEGEKRADFSTKTFTVNVCCRKELCASECVLHFISFFSKWKQFKKETEVEWLNHLILLFFPVDNFNFPCRLAELVFWIVWHLTCFTFVFCCFLTFLGHLFVFFVADLIDFKMTVPLIVILLI